MFNDGCIEVFSPETILHYPKQEIVYFTLNLKTVFNFLFLVLNPINEK